MNDPETDLPILGDTFLRDAMRAKGYNIRSLARSIRLMTPLSLGYKIAGKSPWKLKETYAIMDALGLPYSKIHKYFPSEGRNSP